MKLSKYIIFAPYRLDMANRRLFCGERPGRLVTKDELLTMEGAIAYALSGERGAEDRRGSGRRALTIE